MIRSGILLAAFVAVLAFSAPDIAWAKKKKDNTDQQSEQTAKDEFGDVAVGRRYHPQIVAFYGLYQNDELSAYVRRIGMELAAHTEGDEYEWLFTVLDSETVNAFATPGGFVYITRGLLALLNNEAQLAAILGHEMGHITHRHAARQHTAVEAIASVSDKMAKFDDPNRFNLGDLFGAGLISGYGREMELEADEIGAQLTAAIGHDPKAMLEVMELFKALEQYSLAGAEEQEANRYHTMLATHPDHERRRRELVDAASEEVSDRRDPGREVLLKQIDGIAWQGSKTQGVVRGNRFLHQQMDFAVTFPEGWQIVNLPDKLIGLSPQEAGMMQLSFFERASRKRKKLRVDNFLQKVLGLSKWQSAQVLKVNGLDAFIATVPQLTGLHGRRTGRVGVVFRGSEAFVFFGTTKDADRQRRYDRQFDQIIKSITTLDAADKLLSEPAAIRVVELAPGGSLADFPPINGAEDSIALLRLINGLYPDGEPQPGDKIKTIQ